MRVIGCKYGRCDATLKRESIAVCDPEIAGNSFHLYLSSGSLTRLKAASLFPREWLRISLRTSPNYRLVSGERYSSCGEAVDNPFMKHAISSASHDRTRFPDEYELRRSPKSAVAVAIVCEGDDLLDEVLGSVSLTSILRHHPQSTVYNVLDRFARRKRQTAEIQDLINSVVLKQLDDVPCSWVIARWGGYGRTCMSSLVPISLRVLGWSVTYDYCRESLAAIEPMKRWSEYHGWRLLLKAAPDCRRQRMRSLFIDMLPAAIQAKASEILGQEL